MNRAKDKDRILAEIKAYTPHQQIVGLDKYLPELEREGLVKIWPNEQGEPIAVRLTKQGHDFIKAGGYSKHKESNNSKSTNQIISKVVAWVMGIVASVIAGLIVWILTH